MTTLTDLERLARAATPGPYYTFPVKVSRGFQHWITVDGGATFARCTGYPVSANACANNAANNGAYIAALSPERVLAMIAVIDAAKAMRADPTYRSGHLQAFDEALAQLEQT